MANCSECGFNGIIPNFNFCPICGTRLVKKNVRAKPTNEPLTDEDWKRIMNVEAPLIIRNQIFDRLRKNGNRPEMFFGLSVGPDQINGLFVRAGLPYRLRRAGRSLSKCKLYKVRS